MQFKAIPAFLFLSFLFISAGCTTTLTPTLQPVPITSTITPLINTAQSPMVVTTQPPTEEPTAQVSPQACPPIDSVELTLKLNALYQVIVRWEVHGGCAPYHGTLVAWYQDEFKPYATYTIAKAKGQLLDAPIVHLGVWDIDYTLEISDEYGHSGRIIQTISIGQ